MASRYGTRVQVYRPQIQGMFLPGGEVNEEATKITTEVLVDAVARSVRFSRSGDIASSHRRSVVPSGIYGTRGYVENTSDHAIYKHEGTQGPIYPKRRNYLQLPAFGGYPAIRAESVSGQTGEPWLRDAANDVLSRYGVRVTGADVAFG